MPITLEHYKLIYMQIRLLCAHEMTKHVCKISRLNSKRLLRKLQKNIRGLLYFAAPCRKNHRPMKDNAYRQDLVSVHREGCELLCLNYLLT